MLLGKWSCVLRLGCIGIALPPRRIVQRFESARDLRKRTQQCVLFYFMLAIAIKIIFLRVSLCVFVPLWFKKEITQMNGTCFSLCYSVPLVLVV